jgi:ribosomal protein L16
MLLPKKTKFRKYQRGRRRGYSKGQTTVQFGDYGLKALETGWITNRQIEAARIAMTRKIKRGGKVWINVFPARALGRGDQAGPCHVRARRRAGAAREGSAAPGRDEAVAEDEVREAGGGSL